MAVQPIANYTLHGKPTRVFPFPPNWSSQLKETLEWKTDVMRSWNGTEQRRQLRQNPRRGFEYSILLAKEFASMFEAYLWGWQSNNFALPVWTDKVKLTVDAPVGGSTVQVDDTTDLTFRAGDYVVVYQSPKAFEVVKVDSVGLNAINLNTQLLNTWPAGSSVMPLVTGHLATVVKTSRENDAVLTTGGIMFQCSPEDTYSGIPTIAASTFYDGYEVCTEKPNWKSAIDNDFNRQFDIVDADVGPIGYYPREQVTTIDRSFPWFIKNRSQMTAFRAFMGRLRGQAKCCWMPSWHDDFTLAAGNAGQTHMLTVKGIWFAGMVGVDSNRDRLMVTLPNGTNVFRRIVQVAPNYSNDTTQLQLDSVLGTTISGTDNVRIRHLMLTRLATDKIVIPWHTDKVATPTTAFTTVKI